MSDELYLIAHKVRGALAFDVAIQMTCPTCEGTNDNCHTCDGIGSWWIIPTSGHRAFPWWHWPLEATELNGDCNKNLIELAGAMPPSLRDHYTTEREASVDLLKALGLSTPRTPSPPIKRRF